MTRIIKKIFLVLTGMITTLGLAAVALPAQGFTTGECGDDAPWSWSVSNPASYQAGDHEIVVGLSEARRTFKIIAPETCELEVGDRWQLFSGAAGFSADGVVDAADLASDTDTDTVNVEVPSSNSIAGDDLVVRLRVDDVSEDPQDTWDVDKSSSLPRANLLRRTYFKYQTIDNRINFAEPYQDDQPVRSGGNLRRASWTSNAYFGYEGRRVDIQTRDDLPGAPYGTRQVVITGSGGTVRSSFVVSDPGEPDPGDTFIARARYGGNGVSSGNWSIGDRVAPS